MIVPNQTNIPYNLDFTKESETLFAIRGAHSNIPPCCIYFWITSYRPCSDEEMLKYIKLIPANTGYIPCPKCLENKTFVEIHICDKNNPLCKRMNYDWIK